jgi:osmoprotectant transport system permease protein
MRRLLFIILALLVLALTPLSRQRDAIGVGSKKFTESVILGEVMSQLIQSTGRESVHQRELGGTKIVFQALVNGEIDAYPDYTGTIREEILAGEEAASLQEMRDALGRRGVMMSKSIGFNNHYALATTRKFADKHEVRSISDLLRVPAARLGFSNEFVERQRDGWPALRRWYGLQHRNVTGMDHDLAYRQLMLGVIDVIDVYSTDAKIEELDLFLLEDDRQKFPRYDAVVLYREALQRSKPQVVDALLRLEGALDEPAMIALNAQAERESISEPQVAAGFLKRQLSLHVDVAEETVMSRLGLRTLEHLDLVRRSLIPAILIAIPLGIWAAKRPALGQLILGLVGSFQTIPSIALLVLLMAPVATLGFSSIGTGSMTAVIALLLYSLLPIVRNTYTGLRDIRQPLRESALALGLSSPFRLLKIELPLASPTILAGVKTSAVMNIGFATLGALIGAGGYGQPILSGIRRNDVGLIMEGALPAAALALAVQGLFELAERFLVPKGLRLF